LNDESETVCSSVVTSIHPQTILPLKPTAHQLALASLKAQICDIIHEGLEKKWDNPEASDGRAAVR